MEAPPLMLGRRGRRSPAAMPTSGISWLDHLLIRQPFTLPCRSFPWDSIFFLTACFAVHIHLTERCGGFRRQSRAPGLCGAVPGICGSLTDPVNPPLELARAKHCCRVSMLASQLSQDSNYRDYFRMESEVRGNSAASLHIDFQGHDRFAAAKSSPCLNRQT